MQCCVGAHMVHCCVCAHTAWCTQCSATCAHAVQCCVCAHTVLCAYAKSAVLRGHTHGVVLSGCNVTSTLCGQAVSDSLLCLFRIIAAGKKMLHNLQSCVHTHRIQCSPLHPSPTVTIVTLLHLPRPFSPPLSSLQFHPPTTLILRKKTMTFLHFPTWAIVVSNPSPPPPPPFSLLISLSCHPHPIHRRISRSKKTRVLEQDDTAG